MIRLFWDKNALKMNLSILYQHFKNSTGVSTDTRKIEKGTIFFALKGPNFDANSLASMALNMGASLVVIDDKSYYVAGDERYFLVENSLKALQDLANFHRKTLTIPIIGLTGSNGKTTTKELMKTILSTKFKTAATIGNLNNHIGVPLTLLAINEAHEIAIVEMGANKQGDIEELCLIAEPTHGIITNIGRAHLEGMGGPEGVLKTKTELFQFLRENDKVVFINSQDSILSNLAKRFDSPVLYPSKGDFCEVTFQGANPFVKFSVEESEAVYLSHLIGSYNFQNIATALTVGKFFGVDMMQSVDSVVKYEPSNMRSQLIEKRSNVIILDAYNANPSSMEVAIRTFGEMTGKKHKMMIIGDMFELGVHAETEHARLGEIISEYQIDKICFTGQLISSALAKCPKALYFPDPFSFRVWLQDSKIEDYLILIKGSRGMKLEGLVDFI